MCLKVERHRMKTTARKGRLRTMTSEERHVRDRLERWCGRVDQVRRMLVQEYPDAARAHYATLKRDLKDEIRLVSNSRRDPPLTNAERHFYDRPIRQAVAHLLTSTNASIEKILASVSQAHSDLSLGLARLKGSA